MAAKAYSTCLAEVTLLSSGISPERTHRQIVASVGELSADLDAALADGVLDDRERAQHASKLRQLAARCEQGARNVSAVGEK